MAAGGVGFIKQVQSAFCSLDSIGRLLRPILNLLGSLREGEGEPQKHDYVLFVVS